MGPAQFLSFQPRAPPAWVCWPPGSLPGGAQPGLSHQVQSLGFQNRGKRNFRSSFVVIIIIIIIITELTIYRHLLIYRYTELNINSYVYRRQHPHTPVNQDSRAALGCSVSLLYRLCRDAPRGLQGAGKDIPMAVLPVGARSNACVSSALLA